MGKHGQYRSLVIAAVGAAVLACSAAPAFSACRLALLLGFDASSSVDPGEDRLQRQGIAQALTAPEIRTILLSTPDAPVVLAAYEWSGRYHQTMVLNWTALSSHAAIDNAAAIIATSRRAYSEFPTAVGHSLQFAAKVFETAPRCDFLTLDLSGDGVNNDGFGPRYVYETNDFNQITVNGLAIGGGTTDDQVVFDFFFDRIIRGPGSFVETAANFNDFARAMRRKLYREISLRIVGKL